MPTALDKVLELIGLSTPFLYAFATYGCFRFLDKKASAKAKAAITGWFKPIGYDKIAVATAIVEIFDRIYGSPLFSFRAFIRSAIISAIVALMFSVEIALSEPDTYTYSSINWLLGLIFFSVILSDYVSLFFVRKWLTIKWKSPLLALLTGAVVGGTIVVLFYALRALFIAISIAIGFVPARGGSLLDSITGFAELVWALIPFILGGLQVVFWGQFKQTLILAALAVHLWLPLFAFGVLIIQLVNSFVWSVAKMQWFLKQGRQHPFEAIGYVAAGLVFVATALLQMIFNH